MSPRPDKLSNILIRVPNWLGDTMMSTAAVKEVQALYPQARVSILAKAVFSTFWKDFPGVEEVIPLEKGFSGFWRTVSSIQQKEFNAALILPTSFSSAFLAFFADIPVRIGWGGEGRDLFLTRVVPHPRPRQKHLVWEYLDLVHEGFEKPSKEKRIGLDCAVSKEALRGLEQVFADAGVSSKKPFIAFSPGAAYGQAKRWPLPYWKELMGKLFGERNEDFLILGGLEEERYLKPLMEGWGPWESKRLHLLAGRTSPTILAAMLSKCRLLVTNDTGPMHVAAAAGTPTVALFGSTSPTWTRPFGTGHEVIYKHLECSPCFQRTCPIGYKCLRAISVEEVASAVRKILRSPRRIGPEKLP